MEEPVPYLDEDDSAANSTAMAASNARDTGWSVLSCNLSRLAGISLVLIPTSRYFVIKVAAAGAVDADSAAKSAAIAAAVAWDAGRSALYSD